MLRVMDKKGYTDGQMAAMLVNTLIAGAEAPASCLAQTLQELAFNPPVQRLLSDEVARVSRSRRPGAKVNPTREMRQLTTVQAAVMEGARPSPARAHPRLCAGAPAPLSCNRAFRG